MTRARSAFACAGVILACLGCCAAAPGEEREIGFAYSGDWPTPAAEPNAPQYVWQHWSGPRSSYWTPVRDPSVPYYEALAQYERNRVDRRLHVQDASASSGRIGLTLWTHQLMGATKITTHAVFGRLFASPPPEWPANDPRRSGIYSVPVDFYGALDVTPSLFGGYDGADAPIAHAICVTTKASGYYPGGVIRFLRDRREPDYQILAGVDPTRENVNGAVASLERQLVTGRATGASQGALLNLGWLHHRFTRDRQKALWCFERAYRSFDTAPKLQDAAAYYYGVALEDVGRVGEAKQVYLKLLRTYPEAFWTTDAIERLEWLGVPRRSLRLGLSASGDAATRRYLQAFSSGNYSTALRQARAVSAAHPYDPWSRLYEAYLLRLQPDPVRADRSLASLRRDWPPYAAALKLLCNVFSGHDEKELPILRRFRVQTNGEAAEPLPFLLARIRDRTERFPEDPLAWLLRAQTRPAVEIEGYVDPRPIGLDPLAEYRRAVQLAPRSWAIRMYALNHGEHDSAPRPQRLPVAELAENLEALLRMNEADTWGLHARLADELYVSEVLNRPQLAEEHRRRYELLKKRHSAPQAHP